MVARHTTEKFPFRGGGRNSTNFGLTQNLISGLSAPDWEVAANKLCETENPELRIAIKITQMQCRNSQIRRMTAACDCHMHRIATVVSLVSICISLISGVVCLHQFRVVVYINYLHLLSSCILYANLCNLFITQNQIPINRKNANHYKQAVNHLR